MPLTLHFLIVSRTRSRRLVFGKGGAFAPDCSGIGLAAGPVRYFGLRCPAQHLPVFGIPLDRIGRGCEARDWSGAPPPSVRCAPDCSRQQFLFRHLRRLRTQTVQPQRLLQGPNIQTRVPASPVQLLKGGEQVQFQRLPILFLDMSRDEPYPYLGIGRQLRVRPPIMLAGPPFYAAPAPR